MVVVQRPGGPYHLICIENDRGKYIYTFQIDGVFDEDVYSAQVNSNGFTKEGYLDTMTELFASEIYRDSLTRFNFVTESEIFDLTALLEQTTDITFTKINFDDLMTSNVVFF